MNDLVTNSEDLRFDPLLADIHPNGVVLTDEESVAMWMNLRDVSEDAYQLLITSAVADALLRMRQTLQLTEDAALRIASTVRLLYFGKITAEQLPIVLKDDVGLPQDKVDAVVSFIQTAVLPLKAEKKVEENYYDAPQANTVPLALLDAIAQYPRINDQQISGERIRIRSEKDLVRGSVRNWLRAYRDIVGARKHSAVERGQFLFQAENTKKLLPNEREKLSAMLKSLDDNEALAINPEKQEIVFPASSMPAAASPIPAQSFGQQLPQSSVFPEDSFFQAQSAQPIQNTQAFPQGNINFAQNNNPFANPSFGEDASVSTGQISFSSGQTLPAERQSMSANQFQPRQSISKASFGLNYADSRLAASKENSGWEIPASMGNVVDLRSNE